MKPSTWILLAVATLGTVYLFKDKLFPPAPVARPSPTLNPLGGTGGGDVAAVGNAIAGVAGLFQGILNKLPSAGQSNAQTL